MLTIRAKYVLSFDYLIFYDILPMLVFATLRARRSLPSNAHNMVVFVSFRVVAASSNKIELPLSAV